MAAPDNTMPWLKSLVIGLGVLILLGLALLTYGFLQKARDPGWRLFSSPRPAAPATSGGTAAKAFGNLNLRLPEGCVIAAIRPDGDRVYLTIGPGERLGGRPGEGSKAPCNRVIVVDIVQGRVLGTVRPGQ